jgi:hypothetical protein
LGQADWDSRLSNNLDWTQQLVRQLVPTEATGVVIFAHAKPTAAQEGFMIPMADFVKVELGDKVPFLYLHGDGHSWKYTPSFFAADSYLRIQHAGGVTEPILKLYADPHRNPTSVKEAFVVDRRLNEMTV